MTKSSRPWHGCKCDCGTITQATYAPGHDAKHVSKLVAMTTATWGDRGGRGIHTTTMWTNALRTLGTPGLQAKYRRAMLLQANRHLTSIVREMESENWQALIKLRWDIARIDPTFERSGTLTLAEAAAAMGYTRHTINVKHS